MNQFEARLKEHRIQLKKKIEILQVNMGKLCNLACVHCHVEAGPTKTKQNMDEKTAEAVIRLMDHPAIKNLDITGGAPELNPNFRRLVLEARKKMIHVIDRCNLTVFYEPNLQSTPSFLAENEVEVIASLPCYSKENVDKQRGKGTFNASIDALRWLNRLGYGKEGSDLELNLVYNPVGPHLPPAQEKLEQDYKERLLKDFGIVFHHLYTITNMPITRYAQYLRVFHQYDVYVELLINGFNPHTLNGLMCLNTLSVSWDGKLYDCDFNQAIGMGMNGQVGKSRKTVFDLLSAQELNGETVVTGNHCFGCAAGSGSSCQGALV